ncbi:S8 family serine peptidase [Nocardioides caldifontis]|uniref:S8 family serine peptidase n=1 Tax=Nocardioides caldifontis TaxID=2588938 RepID=UPI0011DFAAE4|nr:S8 family serine peptidase [Nocardioides caldifontis]
MARARWIVGVVGVGMVAGAGLVPGSVQPSEAVDPTPVPEVRSALGNGLGRLLADDTTRLRRKAVGGLRFDQEALTVRDDAGRVLVSLTPQQGVARQAFRRQAEELGMVVTATDPEVGTLEGFVPLDAVRSLASLEGTGTLAQVVKPQGSAGSVDWAGVPFQRVDEVHRRGITGSGVTIGALSDSFDTATELNGAPPLTRAADDVASGDLPGPGNRRNPNPVVVLEDYDAPDASDEGRGMLQIAHDVAPRSRLCFATAFTGLVGFADNVRRLADRSGPCRADVIVDDVAYFDEPFFSDSILSDAIDDVAADGVHYFSSAGNQGQQNAWESRVRLVSPERGVAGSDLDFSQVDPDLYDGGLQDVRPGPGVDIAQTITLGEAGGLLSFQWDDPFDLDGATYGDPIFEATGAITAAEPEPSFTFTATPEQVGTTVEIRVDGIPSGSTDLLLTVETPDGEVVGPIDTGTSPELLATEIDTAGDYTITVTGFQGEVGDFEVVVRPVTAPSQVTADFNVLFFDADGGYLGALSDLNTLSGRPIEIVALAGLPEIQMVVSRAGTGPMKATRLRAVANGDWYFTEYENPFAPSVFGHSAAAGATGVAAYEPFRPFLPEYFTSVGGRLPVLFDSEGNRYRRPQQRTSPLIASTDGGNTTFFFSDTTRDPDTLPNFFGTSAAAPHAAAVAALVLDERGRMKPEAMRRLMSRSTFAHDLDPFRSGGRKGGLTVRAFGPQGAEGSPVPGTLDDTDFFRLRYDGKKPLKQVTFYGETASPTALGKRGKGGIVFDPRPFDAAGPFSEVGFPFTVGSTSRGLSAKDVRAVFSVPAGGDAPKGVYRRMTLKFPKGLKRGQWLTFGVDRDLAMSPFGDVSEGNGADELGGAISIPQGTGDPRGMVFEARRTNGSKIVGQFRNRLGKGYSPVDGYGLLDAKKTVLGGR